MKIRQNYLLVVFFLILTYVSLNDSQVKRVEATTTTQTAVQTHTEAAAKPKKAKKAKKGGKKGTHTNSIGLKVDTSVILEKYPFHITRCDQLVLFKAKYIWDMGDYRFRKDGFFTISAYYVNQFRDKDAKQLDQSILLTESNTIARHIRGARGCVLINGGKHRKDIAVCLANKKQAKNILNVLAEFQKCRMGDDLKPIKADLIKKLIRACGKNGKFINPFKLARQMRKGKGKKGNKKGSKTKNGKKKLRKFSNNPWENDRRNHFHPAPLKVPGSR
jgi:hypothetical protein